MRNRSNLAHIPRRLARRRSAAERSRAGFTLIELMVTVAVLAILAAIAIPSMSQLIVRSRMDATLHEFVSAINMARSEAVRRATRVTLCRATGPTTCGGAGTTWASGWIVFVDDLATAGLIDAGEEIIKSRSAWVGMDSVITSASVSGSISYTSNGQLENAFNLGQIAFTPKGGAASDMRYVCINRTGRPRVDELPCS
ncbi:MAG: GspH/FimT family pseudopilin [Burkholderiales bacterium]|nr:GspH/FimT family pseudopilin [Burkholderiales bacterium]